MRLASAWRARLTAAARESRVASVVADSVLARGLARASVLGWRSLSAERSWLGRAFTRRPVSDFSALARVSTESGLYRLAAAGGAAFSAPAWRASAVSRFLTMTFGSADATGRIRLVAWAGMVMVVVRLALAPAVLSGPTLAPVWLPLLGVCIALFAGAPLRARRVAAHRQGPDAVRDSRFS